MPTSISDFCNQVTSAKPPTGAIFYTQMNQDGSVAVYRAASKSAVATLLYPSVRYLQFADIGNGSGMATQTAAAFIAGLN
jgi:hypothetical protein